MWGPLTGQANNWIQDWTIFYWAWWIAWAPFVGTFIARVSKGRTVREFVIGVLLVPTVFGAFWFCIRRNRNSNGHVLEYPAI
nr:BCCT family transporter [Thermoactinomyces mirandus]